MKLQKRVNIMSCIIGYIQRIINYSATAGAALLAVIGVSLVFLFPIAWWGAIFYLMYLLISACTKYLAHH